jgi:predicted DNA binding CopG/RHH family protein
MNGAKNMPTKEKTKGLHRQTGASVLTAKQKKELKTLAAMPDDQIDLSDIPEATEAQLKNAVRGMYTRPDTKHISIRLSSIDLAIANKLAHQKGLPYQTYIKSLLHETLMKENSK